MSLELDKMCKDRLIKVLKEQLPKLRVSNGKYLDRKSAFCLFLAENILPGTGKTKNNIERFISESPVFDFVYETLTQELSENQEYDSEAIDMGLCELAEYSDPEQTAARIINDLDSLPWEYIFSISIHKELSEILIPIIGRIDLGSNIRISKIGEDFEEKYSLNSGIKSRDQSIAGGGLLSLLSSKENKWDENSICIQFDQSGFVGYYGETATTDAVGDDLKSLCGLCIALRLFKVEYKYRPTPIKAKFYIHRKLGDKWVIQGTRELDTVTSDLFHDLVLHDLDGNLDSEEKKKSWLDKTLSDIDKVFSNRNLTDKILLACQWLFESYSGKNELLSFVQTTIVIEILLGDKATSDQMGLGVLLRNRCAYLIGNTQSQRDEILRDFQEIYNVRSKIVHGGKNRISLDESQLYRKLQWMCRRVIQEEVDLLKKDLQKKT